MQWLKTFYLRAFFVLLQVAIVYSDDNGPLLGFKQQPVDTIIESPNQAILCAVRGEKPLKIAWMKDEHCLDITKSTYLSISPEGSLNIFNSNKKRDQGSYRCVVENKFGRVFSRSAVVTFPYINPFSADISNVRVNEGDQASLSCHAPDSYPDRNIHWLKQTSRGLLPLSLEKSSHYSTSVSGDLYFSYTTNSDKGVYICSVENNVLQRVLKKTVKLEINRRHQRTFPPQVWLFEDKVAMKNTDFMLECISYGRPIPVMKFRHCKTRKILKGAEQIGNRLRYQFGRYLDKEDGQYTCEVSNTFGQEANKTAYIKLEAKPEMKKYFKSLSVSIDSKVRIPCVAEGNPPVSFKWYFNGIPLVDTSEVKIFKGSLTIKKVMKHHQGFYQCIASNRHGEAVLTIHLKVVEMIPHFGAQSIPPAERTDAFIGGNTEMFCVPSGAPKPDVRWQKRDNKNYIKVHNERFIILPSGTLKIVNIRKSDAGIYDCIASNRLGTSNKGGRLSVIGGLVITEPLTKQNEFKTGQKITLVCTVFSSQNMEVAFTWKLGNRKLRKNSRTNIRNGRRQSFLDIKNALNRDTGIYKCEAYGAKGIKSTKLQYILVSDSMLELTRPPGIKTTTEAYKESTDLIVNKGPPYPPTEVTGTEQDGVTIKISWTLGRDNGSPVTKIYLQGRTSYDTSRWFTIKVSNKTHGYRLSEIISLSPWAEYKIRVIAENKNGKSKPSEETSSWIITPSRIPEKYPQNIKGEGTTPTELKITFDPLPKIDQNAPGIHYVVYHKAVGMSYKMIEELVESEKNYIILTFSNTDSYYKLYEFQILARNDIGNGPRSPIHTAYTGERIPIVAPWNLKIKIKSFSYVEASWQGVRKSRQAMRGKFLGYKFLYWRKPEIGHTVRKDKIVTHSRYLTIKLLPYTEYYFQVLAYNSAGDGPVGETVGPIRTPEGIPSMPTNLKLTDASAGYGKLTWNEPLHKNGKIIQYILKYFHRENVNEQEERIDGNIHEFYIAGLLPDKEYVFQLAAVTAAGEGLFANTSFNFSKVPSRKLDPPVIISKTEDKVVLSWSLVNDSSISGYKIFYWHSHGDAIVLWEGKVDILATIQNLEPGATYYFQIAVYNDYGTGPKSDVTRVRTVPVFSTTSTYSSITETMGSEDKKSRSFKLKLNKSLLITVILIAIFVPR